MFEFFAPGAVEICGSGAEAQGGFVLGAATEFGIRAFAKPNGTDNIHIDSEEFGVFDIEIGDTEPRAAEAENFSAIVRGIMNCFVESGNIFGGFDAKIRSEIPPESGISTEGTFGVLIGKIISGLFFENSVPALRLAEFSRAAESDFFGRPCGLAERLVSACGGTVLLDFSEAEMPVFEKIGFDFSKSGHSLALIQKSGECADLFGTQREIFKNLGIVSWNMGHNFLSEADEAEFIAQFPILRQKCGEKAVFEALRFFENSRKALDEAAALEEWDFPGFLELFGENSEEESEILDFVRGFLGEKGAAAPFFGKVLAFVPEENAAEFAAETEKQGFDLLFLI